ncbi:unnamed protein product, partial [Brugia timori]|uniref:Reverse transcriptase domain-containing protein n=1 Tax=Brugia timori TaxID=42155 RepID=A0A0R3R083_9BILA
FRPNDTTHVSIEDCELVLHDHLHSSHNAIDELISHGSAILEQIRSQGVGLRGIKHKVLSIGHTLSFMASIVQSIARISCKGLLTASNLFIKRNLLSSFFFLFSVANCCAS